MRRGSWKLIGWAAISLAPLAMASAAESAAPPRLEQFIAENRGGEFAAAAQAFVDQFPRSPLASEVLLDSLALAIRQKESYLARRLKARLLFEYRESPQTSLVLASFHSAQEYASFLVDSLDVADNLAEPQLASRLCELVRLGGEHWDEDPLDNVPLLIRATLLTQCAPDWPLMNKCVEQLGKRPPDAKLSHTVLALLKDRGDHTAVIVALHAAGENRDAAWCKRYLLSRIPQKEHDDPVILRIDVEDLLLNERWEAALPKISRLLAAERRPQWQYWQILCLAALGRNKQAAQMLEQFQAAADDEWRALATQVVAGKDILMAALEHDALAISTGMRSLADNLEMFEAWADFTLDDSGVPLSVYVGADLPRNEVHIAALVGDRVLAAQRSIGEESWLLVGDDDEIYHFLQRGALLAGEFSISQAADGTLGGDFRLGANSEVTYAEFAGTLHSAISSPFLTTEGGVTKLLLRGIQKGGFPAPPKMDRNGKRLAWKFPGITTTQLSETSLQFDPQGRLTGLDHESLHVRQLRYGRSGSFRLQPPPWPDRPLREEVEYNAGVWGRVMRMAAGLMANHDEQAADKR